MVHWSWPPGSLQLPSTLLQSESLVVQLLEGLEFEGQQLITKLRSQSLAEQILTILIIGHIPRGVARQVIELPPISLEIHVSLVQIQELPPL